MDLLVSTAGALSVMSARRGRMVGGVGKKERVVRSSMETGGAGMEYFEGLSVFECLSVLGRIDGAVAFKGLAGLEDLAGFGRVDPAVDFKVVGGLEDLTTGLEDLTTGLVLVDGVVGLEDFDAFAFFGGFDGFEGLTALDLVACTE